MCQTIFSLLIFFLFLSVGCCFRNFSIKLNFICFFDIFIFHRLFRLHSFIYLSWQKLSKCQMFESIIYGMCCLRCSEECWWMLDFVCYQQDICDEISFFISIWQLIVGYHYFANNFIGVGDFLRIYLTINRCVSTITGDFFYWKHVQRIIFFRTHQM